MAAKATHILRGNLNFLAPITKGVEITPHDTNELDEVTRALECSASGNAEVYFIDDPDTAVTVYMVAGIMYPWCVTRILSTGTTATGIVGFY